MGTSVAEVSARGKRDRYDVGMPRVFYRGWCGACGTAHELPVTREALDAARELARRLEDDRRFGREGKMIGILCGTAQDGTDVCLRAFSGMVNGNPYAEGFAGPTRPHALTAEAESETLRTLRRLSAEIASIDLRPAESALVEAKAHFDREIDRLATARARGKAARAEVRASGATDADLAALEATSQREGGRLRALRAERKRALDPLERELADLSARRTRLRRERRARSRALQSSMHAVHGLVNFAGRYAKLDEFFASGVPTGTGECCAPKLLHEAALRGIRPTGGAEVWCGPPPPSGGRARGSLYPPCEEKCAPILGHLLCGMASPEPPIAVLFEDDDLVAVDKPPGLLSVPGRTSNRADCVETRLSLLRPGEFLRAAHRLDQATSGVLLLARSLDIYRELGRGFAEGRIEKEYRARVHGVVRSDHGEIRLPLAPDPENRPRQRVDHAGGRDARSTFRVLVRRETTTDLELRPRTGRTHQLRIHCASAEGLGAPIVGDRLYGRDDAAARLHLHAGRIALVHPRTGARLEIGTARPDPWTP